MKVSTIDSRREFSVLEGNEKRTSCRRAGDQLFYFQVMITTLAHGVRYTLCMPKDTYLVNTFVFIVTHTETLPLDESRRPESLDGEAGFVDLFMRGTSYAICRGTGCDGDSRDRKGNAL